MKLLLFKYNYINKNSLKNISLCGCEDKMDVTKRVKPNEKT